MLLGRFGGHSLIRLLGGSDDYHRQNNLCIDVSQQDGSSVAVMTITDRTNFVLMYIKKIAAAKSWGCRKIIKIEEAKCQGIKF